MQMFQLWQESADKEAAKQMRVLSAVQSFVEKFVDILPLNYATRQNGSVQFA